MLRVISGIYKSRQLEQPNIKITRPTTDRTKEAIFSMIQSKLKNAIVLDLFSGSGSLAIESISRGAMKAIAIDSNANACNVINKNKQSLNISNMDIFRMDALRYLNSKRGAEYHIIFLDPPYENTNICNEIIEFIGENRMLKLNGYIVLETNNISKIMLPKNLTIQKEKQYGKTNILLISNI